MSLPHALSLCHRCQGCQVVVSGRGSVFLRCLRRAEKYLAQPVRLCPVYAALPVVVAEAALGTAALGPAVYGTAALGTAALAWLGDAPARFVAVADGRGGFTSDAFGPRPVESASAGDALWWSEAGARFVAEAGRGPVLARVIEGAAMLATLPAGATVEFGPPVDSLTAG